MGFKEFMSKSFEKYKESCKPENVKLRLQQDIEIERLKIEKEKLQNERSDVKSKRSYTIGNMRL